MKLFLASSADRTIQLLKSVNPSVGARVLFVANAADPYDNAYWVDLDRIRFQELGYQIKECDLKTIDSASFSAELTNADILHICGGSISYLGWLLNERGVVNVIVEAVRNEEIVYTGTSAGSMIVSEDLAMFSYDDKEEVEFVNRGFTKKGLGLVPWTIAPHSESPDFTDSHKKIIDELITNPTAVVLLHDNQALWVENDSVRFLNA